MNNVQWRALNEPFNIADRVQAFGTMWAEVSNTLPKDEEGRKEFDDTIVVKTADTLLRLKNENRGNEFVLGSVADHFTLGTHYRPASTMSGSFKLSVLMFFCQDDYSENGLGDDLLNFLKNIGMSKAAGRPAEVSIKAVSKKKGVKAFFRRHDFVLDLEAVEATSPSWYTRTFEF